jgi:hypothetical protein
MVFWTEFCCSFSTLALYFFYSSRLLLVPVLAERCRSVISFTFSFRCEQGETRNDKLTSVIIMFCQRHNDDFSRFLYTIIISHYQIKRWYENVIMMCVATKVCLSFSLLSISIGSFVFTLSNQNVCKFFFRNATTTSTWYITSTTTLLAGPVS